MTTSTKCRKINYLWILIVSLVLATIITTVIVIKGKPDSSITGVTINAGHTFPITTQPTEFQQFDPSTGLPTNNNVPPPDASAPLTCTNPRIRKSWKELTESERSAFLNAILQLKSKPSQTNSASNRYDDFAVIHNTYRNFAHNLVSSCQSFDQLVRVFSLA
jgi:hypothetical protein